MNWTIRALLLLTLLTFSFALAACGSADESEGYPGLPGAPGESSDAFQDPAAPMAAMPAPTAAPAATAVPMPAAMPTPVAAMAVPQQPAAARGKRTEDALLPVEGQASLVAQQRIIVRTVDMLIVVADVAHTIDAVAGLAQELGGWVVSSDHSRTHQGFISVRVPAETLDNAVLRLRQLAFDVDSEITTSQDVTDEYVDLKARLKNLQATEEALIRLLERAEKVEDALQVQNELTRIQEDVERLQGRISFLEQTAAFSLINVGLRLAPVDMRVNGGSDQSVSVGEVARFRATFIPPQGIDDFFFTWNFGDGSAQFEGYNTAPTLDGDERVTATITHVYPDDRDSPYIATVNMRGTGEAGVAEGMDTVIVTVTKIPTIEVFAGDNRRVEEGEEFEVSGSFTRPAGLTALAFRWDFGDGSAPVTGRLPEDVTTANATYAYPNYRPMPYTATLTVTAQSAAGEIESSGTIEVHVSESLSWTVGGWNAGDQWKGATRALSGLAQALGTIAIWLVIFSPVWLIGGAIIWILMRRARRYQWGGQTPFGGQGQPPSE